MNIPKTDSPEKVKDALLKPQGDPQMFTMSLSGFKTVFRELQKQPNPLTVDVVLNGDWALVQFTELCNHRIRVLPDSRLRWLPRVLGFHLYLEEKDFEIVATSANFYGQREYLTLWRFIREELSVNGIKSLVIFAVSAAFLILLTQASTSTEILKSANEVLLGIAAIFFSIFMLFTASQKQPSVADLALFKKGLTHRFLQVDKFVAWFAIIALAIAAIGRVLTESPAGQVLTLPNLTITLRDTIPWITSAGITLMSVSLLTVVHYYFERVRYLHETELSKKLLDEVFENRINRNRG
jgi:hypothetical protein